MKKNHITSLLLAITLLVGGLAISIPHSLHSKGPKHTQKSQGPHKKNNHSLTEKNSSLLSIIKKYPIITITGLGLGTICVCVIYWHCTRGNRIDKLYRNGSTEKIDIDWKGLDKENDFVAFMKACWRSKELKIDHPLAIARANESPEVENWLKKKIYDVGICMSTHGSGFGYIKDYLSLLGENKEEQLDFISKNRGPNDHTFLHAMYWNRKKQRSNP